MSKKKLGKLTHEEFLELGGKFQVKPKGYSKKLIAFLDVLGITKLIENTHKDGTEHEAINRIETVRTIIEGSTNAIGETGLINYVQLSDSFVFICEPQVLDRLIELLSRVQMRILMECQLLLRGAITIGAAIGDREGKSIIGPAFIQAYRLQENDAVYPRIIVDKSVISAIRDKGEEPLERLRKDSDHEFFIDYVRVVLKAEGWSPQDLRIRFQREGVYRTITKGYDDNYRIGDHNVWQKYGWTIKYYSESEVWKK